MVMRTDLGRRQRHRNLMHGPGRRSSSETAVPESEQGGENAQPKPVVACDDPMEIEDGIEKMVEEVKKHGVRAISFYQVWALMTLVP